MYSDSSKKIRKENAPCRLFRRKEFFPSFPRIHSLLLFSVLLHISYSLRRNSTTHKIKTTLIASNNCVIIIIVYVLLSFKTKNDDLVNFLLKLVFFRHNLLLYK